MTCKWGNFWTNCLSSPTVFAFGPSSYWAETDLAWLDNFGPTAEKLKSLISANNASFDVSCTVLISCEFPCPFEELPLENFSPGSLTLPIKDNYKFLYKTSSFFVFIITATSMESHKITKWIKNDLSGK